MDANAPDAGTAWQMGVWDRMSEVYQAEIDRRFEPVVRGVVRRAGLRPGARVLDLGTGTGAVAFAAAPALLPGGSVLGIDLSPRMVAVAAARAAGRAGLPVRFQAGRGEAIPARDAEFDAVLASLAVMYATDRPALAREVARVLRPGGTFVASVWAGPEACDIVKFQATAGSFAPAPPVKGVGPGALADPKPFLEQLRLAGIEAHVETEVTTFSFPDFASAWSVLAGVTTSGLPAARVAEAQRAVQAAMWPGGAGAREFRNGTQYVVGRRAA